MDEALEDGWNPTTPDDDTLLRRYVLCEAVRLETATERLGGPVVRTEDAILARPASDVLFEHLALLLRPPTRIDLAAIVADAHHLFGAEAWVLMSAWPLPSLDEHGLQLMGHPPLMFRMPGGDAPARPDELEILEVTDADDLEDWNHTMAAGYPTPGGVVPRYDERLLGGPVRLWIGRVDGETVATAAACVSHDVVDVEFVATLPGARGHGYGEALTWVATLADPRLPAMLIASDLGRPVYESMGYEPLLRCTLWFAGDA